MSDDLQELNKKNIIVSVSTGLTFALFGLVVFLFQWAYSESGHEFLLELYIALAIILIIPIYYFNKLYMTLCISLMALILVYGFLKFDWRRDYVHAAESGHPFILEPYIQNYPTFEDHYFSFLSDAPQWVSFAKDCYAPALNGDITAETCRSQSLINDHYNIDVRGVVNSYYSKMQTTANMLVQGQLMNKDQYRNCLAHKNCALIPLMPLESDGDADDEKLKVRRQFWSLVNDSKISPEICDFVEFCRVMRAQNIIAVGTSAN